MKGRWVKAGGTGESGNQVTLSTSSDKGVVGDSVGSATLLMHFIE